MQKYKYTQYSQTGWSQFLGDNFFHIVSEEDGLHFPLSDGSSVHLLKGLLHLNLIVERLLQVIFEQLKQPAHFLKDVAIVDQRFYFPGSEFH